MARNKIHILGGNMTEKKKSVFPKMTSVGRVKYKKRNTKKTKKIEEDKKKRQIEWRKWWS
jgi:hypothetical protein